MADKNSKNQDSKLDVSPDDDLLNDSTAEQEDALLVEVDNILNEDDPDFLNQLTQIEVGSETADLSIMDQALGLHDKPEASILNIIGRPFELKANPKPVLMFWAALVLVVAAGVIVWNFKSKILHQNLFLNSLAELGSNLQEYNPNSDVEPFYDNLRFAKNLVTISAMHANLKISENSGPNPMLAIEVISEGLSSDAIIEVKDREAEFKDLLLRLTEEKTYDELAESDGKLLLCEQYRDLLNSRLTRGQVRKVFLKSFIIKP